MASPPSPRSLAAHLQAEADVAGLDDVGAPVVLDRVAVGGELDPRRAVHLVQRRVHGVHVQPGGGIGVAGGFQHRAEIAAHGAHRPADGVAVGGLIHAVLHVVAVRRVHVALFDVEAVEPQGRLVAHLNQDYDALVGVVLDVAVPQLVLDDESYVAGIDADSSSWCRHVL